MHIGCIRRFTHWLHTWIYTSVVYVDLHIGFVRRFTYRMCIYVRFTSGFARRLNRVKTSSVRSPWLVRISVVADPRYPDLKSVTDFLPLLAKRVAQSLVPPRCVNSFSRQVQFPYPRPKGRKTYRPSSGQNLSSKYSVRVNSVRKVGLTID